MSGSKSMKITIEPTGRFQSVNGQRTRVWKGVTDKGVECEVFIAVVQVRRAADNSEFERELREVKADRELVSYDLRLFID